MSMMDQRVWKNLEILNFHTFANYENPTEVYVEDFEVHCMKFQFIAYEQYSPALVSLRRFIRSECSI